MLLLRYFYSGGDVQITSGHDIQVALGTKLTLRCTTTDDTLILYWTHNNVEVSDGQEIKMAQTTTLEGEHWLSLIIEESSESSAGVYRCSARNNANLADSANVEVIDE